jgi:hypothetical protein
MLDALSFHAYGIRRVEDWKLRFNANCLTDRKKLRAPGFSRYHQDLQDISSVQTRLAIETPFSTKSCFRRYFETLVDQLTLLEGFHMLCWWSLLFLFQLCCSEAVCSGLSGTGFKSINPRRPGWNERAWCSLKNEGADCDTGLCCKFEGMFFARCVAPCFMNLRSPCPCDMRPSCVPHCLPGQFCVKVFERDKRGCAKHLCGVSQCKEKKQSVEEYWTEEGQACAIGT